MYTRETVVKNKSGLHARPAYEFVECASRFESKIKISRADEEDFVNAKSMVMLLTLGIAQGERMILKASGPDETEAVDTLIALVESGFGEDEE